MVATEGFRIGGGGSVGNVTLGGLSKGSVVLLRGDWAGQIKVADYVVHQF